MKLKCNFCVSAIQDVKKYIKSESISIIIYEPTLEDGSEFARSQVVNDIGRFKPDSDVILANRFDEHILGMLKKKYIQEIFS